MALRTPSAPSAIPQGFAVWTGRLEYMTGIYRDVAIFFVAGTWAVIAMVQGTMPTTALAMVGLGLLARYRRRSGNANAIAYLQAHPDIHPDDFFDIVELNRSVWRPRGPLQVRTLCPDKVDFRKGDVPRWAPDRLLKSFHDTAFLAYLAMQGYRIGTDVGTQIFDPITRLWTTRLAANLHLRLEVTGLEHLRDVQHNAIIALNHESVLDFALAFFSVGGVETGRGKRMRLRFLAAKDHFIDNPILYSVMGIGRAIEQAGMIFVDRKKRGEGAKSVHQAVDAIRKNDVDVAIFPQGTRATAHYDVNGDPYGGGYYTTTKGSIAGIRFFRSGVSRIAGGLAKHQPVDIICVGLEGVGKVMPARRFTSYTNRVVRFTILPPLHLDKQESLDEQVISERIELHLRHAANVHARLLNSWQQETGASDEERIAVAQSMAHWDDAPDPAGYAVLDAILTKRIRQRPSLLAEFKQLKEQGFPAEPFMAFRKRIGKG
jgi:1-acyl-sn-glycerol-3-phosphate acyltransferase